METERVKRKGSKNFTELEVRFLIDLVIKYIKIVENKKTDAISWTEKENTWQQIASEFEALSGTGRSSGVLKTKYESFKHTLKSKITKNKTEIFKTGGGKAKLEELTDIEQKLTSHITLNVEGLPSTFDSDSGTISNTHIISFTDAIESNTVQISSDENATIQNPQQSSTVLTDAESNIPVVMIEELTGTLSQPPESLEEKENIQTHTWSTWNPRLLRTPKNKALNTPKRKKNDNENLKKKLDEMVSSRRELLQFQNEAAKKELKYKEEDTETERVFLQRERQLKLELLELKIENQKFKRQLLKEQLKKFTQDEFICIG